MLLCSNCKQYKEETEFTKRSSFSRGYEYVCKSCLKIYRQNHKPSEFEKNNRKIRKAKRKEEYAKLKDHPCKDCGIKYDPVCMDFDHLHSKYKNVSHLAKNNYKWESVLKEIEKCDLVCALCHNKRTFERSNKKSPVKKYTKCVQRNINVINKAKSEPCYICGKTFEIYNMQLDHISPEDKFKDICQLKGVALETLLKELEKCKPICILCHRLKTLKNI